jgi:hypothetical protein
MFTLLLSRHFIGRALFSFFVALQVCVFVATQPASCQQQSIVKGIVTDSVTGRPVFDANIVVLGTTLGAGSDSSGHYVIHHLSREWHVIKVTHLGFMQFYQALMIPLDVDTITLNVSLSPAVIPLEGVTTVGESRVHELGRFTTREFVSGDQIQRDGSELMEDIFCRHAPYALSRGYELYVDDFRWPKNLLGTINVHDIKEMFIWDWKWAPIQYRLGPGELEAPTPTPGKPSATLLGPTYRHMPFIVLIRTK